MTTLPHARLHLRVVSHSEVGLVRKNNQDSGYASPHLLVVADGMGGAAAGDLASAVAIDVIKRLDRPDLLAAANRTSTLDDSNTADGTEPTVIVPGAGAVDAEPRPSSDQGAAGRNPLLGRFAEAIGEANTRIADLVAADYSLEGMGTTVTGALFDGDRLALAHIGDSRAYLLRDGRLERLTHDHSWVQSLVDDGKIRPEDAAYHPHRSLLLKVLNGQPANNPDLTTVELRPGDRLLFCSDGLCGMIDDPEIADLAANPDLQAAVGDLVDAALAAGGIDNITVILAEVVEGPGPAPVAATGRAASAADDTAVRRSRGTAAAAAAAGVVLGAAADRKIPVVPRRSPVVPGFEDDDEDGDEDGDEADDEAADDTSTPPVAVRSPATGRADTVDDESRYAPRPPAKRRIVRTLLVALAVLLVTAAGLGAGYAWTRTQYFVGASDGQVAIYSGLPDGIPGLPLSQLYEVQELPVASLPPYYQAKVIAGIEVSNLDAARDTVEQLKQTAARCAQPSTSPPATAKPNATPRESATTTPAPTRSTPATANASVSAQPTSSARPTSSAQPTPTTGAPGQGC